MICAWNELMKILPMWLRTEAERQERSDLREIRLREGSPPEFVLSGKSVRVNRTVQNSDIQYCINSASQYSPWAAATCTKGYLTAPGGHRIGLCGETVIKNGMITAFQKIHSLCIRVAKDFPGIGREIDLNDQSVLLLGSPGCGKTTLLRDLIRKIGQTHCVGVVDERGELFPSEFPAGKKVDILSGCGKAEGIEMLLRTMGPEYIAVDEITSPEDSTSLLLAYGCGVHLIATAHAGSVTDFQRRKSYAPIIESRVFDKAILLNRNCSFLPEGVPL